MTTMVELEIINFHLASSSCVVFVYSGIKIFFHLALRKSDPEVQLPTEY